MADGLEHIRECTAAALARGDSVQILAGAHRYNIVELSMAEFSNGCFVAQTVEGQTVTLLEGKIDGIVTMEQTERKIGFG